MRAADVADLAINLTVGFSVLFVGGIFVLALRHTMKSCECCSPPTESEGTQNPAVVERGGRK